MNSNTTPQLSPLRMADRIIYLDILRGIAILFIFLANVPHLSGTAYYSNELNQSFATAPFDRALKMIFLTFIDGKFYSVFSILFGIGFVVQYNNAKKNNKPFNAFFRRRMLGLLLIGLVHLFFIWIGDILTLYALLGFALIWFKNFSDKQLLIWAAVLLLLPVVNWIFMNLTGIYYPALFFEAFNSYNAAHGMELTNWDGSGYLSPDPNAYLALTDFSQYMQITVGNPMLRFAMLLWEGRFFKVLGLFLIGIWAGRQILNKNILDNRLWIRKIALWGTLIGLPLNICRTIISFGHLDGPLYDFLSTLFYALGVVPLACAYAAFVALMVISRPNALSWFAPVGQTALSNYLFQSVICIVIFYGVGMGNTGKLSFTEVVLISLTIFAWQVAFSTIWLRHFKFGPVEWIWRQMTYGEWISIKQPTAGMA